MSTTTTIIITCVDKDDKGIITKLNYKIDGLINGQSLKASFINKIREFEKTTTVILKTTLNEEVDIIKVDGVDKYLRTKANKSTTDDLGDLPSCPINK